MRRLIVGLLAALAFAAPAQAAHHTTRYRVHQLEKQFDRLIEEQATQDEAQEAEIHQLQNANAGLKNTLLCFHAVPIVPLVLTGTTDPAQVLQVQTTGYVSWAVTVDDYCLTNATPNATHRLQVPVEPPTFYPEN